MFAKIEVNGDGACDLYNWLKSEKPGDIGWNFTKFLVGKDGQVLERFEPQVTPEEIGEQLDSEFTELTIVTAMKRQPLLPFLCSRRKPGLYADEGERYQVSSRIARSWGSFLCCDLVSPDTTRS